MRHLFRLKSWLAGASLALSLGQPALAERAVLVELFTAQGCSSCPPADALLADLAQSPGVVALALHVDYWDYLGWTDAFGDPAHSARQETYAQRHGLRMVYTPQMVFDGQRFAVGSDAAEVANALMARARVAQRIEISAAAGAGEGMTAVSLRAVAALSCPCDVLLAVVDPAHEVEIKGGENAGQKIRYINVIRDLRPLAPWDGQPHSLSVPLPPDGRAALIVQEAGQGEVLAAIWLN